MSHEHAIRYTQFWKTEMYRRARWVQPILVWSVASSMTAPWCLNRILCPVSVTSGAYIFHVGTIVICIFVFQKSLYVLRTYMWACSSGYEIAGVTSERIPESRTGNEIFDVADIFTSHHHQLVIHRRRIFISSTYICVRTFRFRCCSQQCIYCRETYRILMITIELQYH